MCKFGLAGFELADIAVNTDVMRQLLLVISDGADAADKGNDLVVFSTVPELPPPETGGIKRIPDILIKRVCMLA